MTEEAVVEEAEDRGAAEIQDILDSKVEVVSWRDIRVHPKNPRKGNIDAIAESLKENGQFRPLIVQRSTGYIIGGNHTYLGSRKLRWKTVKVVYLDVTDAQAEKIMLADNRTSDLGTYDTDALASILKGISNPAGTGYNDSDVRAILAAIDDKDEMLLTETVRPKPEIVFSESEPLPFDERVKDMQKSYDERIGARLRDELTMTPEEEALFQKNVTLAEIQIELEALQDSFWPIENYWGVPELRTDMMVEEIPDPINTWGGADATPDDGVTTWIWNYGLAASKDLPWDRAMMAMFTYDTKFDAWFDNPAYQAARVIFNGLTQAIAPDTSFWSAWPRYTQLKAQYQSMWLARFLQEAGIKIMPRIMFCDPESIKIGILGIPPKPKCIAVCIQAASEEELNQGMAPDSLREFVKIIQPESLLVYSGNPGREVVEQAHLPKELHVVHVDNYAAVRRHMVYDKPVGKTAVEKKLATAERLKRVEARQSEQEAKEQRAAERAAKKAEAEAIREAKARAKEQEQQPAES